MHKITVKDFPTLDLGDKRRDERFVKIIENIVRHPGGSILQHNDSTQSVTYHQNATRLVMIFGKTLVSHFVTISRYETGVGRLKKCCSRFTSLHQTYQTPDETFRAAFLHRQKYCLLSRRLASLLGW